jgi:hypothetical protein
MTRTTRAPQALWTLLGVLLLFAAAPAALAAPSAAMYARCAKACKTCMTACQTCTTHCEAMIKSGMTEHRKTARISADCRDLCDVAARLCARKGPMTADACKACLSACDACGKECKKYPAMKPMKDCGKACDVCEKACKEMIVALR